MALGEDTLTSEIHYRDLSSSADFEQCLGLQQLTWGEDFRELVPPTVLRISQKVGGIAAGAFDSEGRQLGFVWGLTGQRQGDPVHWSHMLAVHPDAQGLGLGKGLKYFQRDRLLTMGVRRMYWTYDPLVARNATLNLVRLGARPEEYVVDMYGAMTGSDLHSGLGTDRFVVAWDLERSSGSSGASEGRSSEAEGLAAEADPSRVLNLDAAGRPVQGDAVLRVLSRLPVLSLDGSSRFWLEIPADIESLKRSDRALALAYRDSLRALLPELFAAGWIVDGFCWIGANRGRYRLSPRSTG